MITAPGVTPVIVIIVTMISAGDSSHGAESSNTGGTNRSGTDLLTKIKIQILENYKWRWKNTKLARRRTEIALKTCVKTFENQNLI